MVDAADLKSAILTDVWVRVPLPAPTFFTPEKIFFVTNFHVVDDANGRIAYLRTASMGKSMFTSYVEAVVPKLDIAILSITKNAQHDKWFLSETPDEYLTKIKTAQLCEKRISSKTRKVSTIGFPQGLENQVSSGWLAGRGLPKTSGA